MKKAQLIFDAKAELGESPLWDSENKILYWADITRGELHRFNPADGSDSAVKSGRFLSDIVLSKNGLLLAKEDGLHLCGDGGDSSFLGAPEGYAGRFNDGKCDPKGRLYIGTCGCGEGNANLYRFFDGKWDVALSGISISNGIVWSADGKTMYYTDTATKEIWAFDYSLKDGSLSNKRVAVVFANGEGGPDGMSIDSDGMLWVAQWGAFRVGRWNPLTGKCLSYIEVDARNVSACAFGGDDLKTLYITTAREGMPEEDAVKYPHSGGLFKAETDVSGTLFHKYAGRD
ncbi:MAG: SMP-30/gluconolactonase/LRE family protein [Clostridiales bacterium]|jgi:sugar lactone lactonase YvrE|nr:SMP-30/gluconolactonase/LRE family protein [Clostridiales bacterium]